MRATQLLQLGKLMDRPLNVQRHITLSVDAALDNKKIKSWFSCVKKYSPSGVVATLQTVDEDGSPRAVKLVHREIEKKNFYIIPLTRDLLPDEVEKIVEKFVEENPELDFDIETHAGFQSSLVNSNFSPDAGNYIALCNALSKQKHDEWMKEKIQSEWRYGNELSLEHKTHPLLLPWEQLPDKYKQPDLEWPKKIMDIMSAQGYAVLPKYNLEKMVSLLKKGF